MRRAISSHQTSTRTWTWNATLPNDEDIDIQGSDEPSNIDSSQITEGDIVKWKDKIEVLPFGREHKNESKYSYWCWPPILLMALDYRWPNQRDFKRCKCICSACYNVKILQTAKCIINYLFRILNYS